MAHIHQADETLRIYLEGLQGHSASARIALLGDNNCEKRSIYNSMVRGYVEPYDPFEYEDMYPVDLSVHGYPTEVDLYYYHLDLVDAAGEVRLQDCLKLALDSDCIALVYDGRRRETFEHIVAFYAEWKTFTASSNADSKLYMVIVSRTSFATSWEVPLAEAEAFSKSINAEFRQMSAFSGDGTSREDLREIAGNVLMQKARNEATARASTNATAAESPGGFWRRLRLHFRRRAKQ